MCLRFDKQDPRDVEACAAGLAFGDRDRPAVGLDDLFDNLESKPSAVLARCLTSVENRFPTAFRHSTAVVFNKETKGTTVRRARVRVHHVFQTDTNRDRSLVVVDCVPKEILENMWQPVGVTMESEIINNTEFSVVAFDDIPAVVGKLRNLDGLYILDRLGYYD